VGISLLRNHTNKKRRHFLPFGASGARKRKVAMSDVSRGFTLGLMTAALFAASAGFVNAQLQGTA
jgi:hypothetical protein